jgi:hypothetical protein
VAFQAKNKLRVMRKSLVDGCERNALAIEPTLIDSGEIHPVGAKLQATFGHQSRGLRMHKGIIDNGAGEGNRTLVSIHPP